MMLYSVVMHVYVYNIEVQHVNTNHTALVTGFENREKETTLATVVHPPRATENKLPFCTQQNARHDTYIYLDTHQHFKAIAEGSQLHIRVIIITTTYAYQL